MLVGLILGCYGPEQNSPVRPWMGSCVVNMNMASCDKWVDMASIDEWGGLHVISGNGFV